MAQVLTVAFAKDRAHVELEGGRTISLRVAAPAEAAGWVAAKAPYAFGDPVLFVARKDEAAVCAAVAAMAADMGGYWLRYYDCARGSAPPQKIVPLATASWRQSEPGCGVVEVVLKDGRAFSLLSASPEWFAKAFAKLKLPYYFGPCVLFLKTPGAVAARVAAKAMAAAGESWLCRYDTPRRALPDVLQGFKAAQRAPHKA